MMTPFEARKVLGLGDVVLTTDVVDAAYRKALKQSHPDTAEPGSVVVAYTMANLQHARKLLRDVVAQRNNPCPQCRGRGTVPGRFGAQSCAACNGTGDKQP